MSDNIIDSIGYSISSFLFVILILIMYAGKIKFTKPDNKIYLILCILTGIISINNAIFVLCLKYASEMVLLNEIICKFYLCLLIIWLLFFIYYILFQLTRKYDESIRNLKRNRTKISLYILGLILIILTCILPIEFYDYTEQLYFFGGKVFYPFYAIEILCVLSILYGIIFSYKNLSFVDKLTLLFALLTVILLTFLEINSKTHNSQSVQFIIVLFALFFTLEDQDNKLLKIHEDNRIKAENANKEQTDFLTSISHEIRTPLSAIMGLSDVLIRDGVKNQTEVIEEVKDINYASNRLLDLIKNILNLSRIESHQDSDILVKFKILDVIIKFNDEIKSKIDSSKIKFNIVLDENIPSVVYGDPGKIIKILLNLVSDIINCTPKGSITLIMKNSIVNNEYKLETILTSEGSEKQHSEFDNPNTTNMVSAESLCNNVSKIYARMLNTEIKTNSIGETDISYSVLFGLKVIDNTIIGNVNNLLNIDYLVNIEGKKILVVDDNNANIKILSRLFEDFNVNFDYCNSENECISKIQNNDYDLIFLDYHISNNEVEFLYKIKSIKSNLPPIIALISSSYSLAREKFINEGFNDFLTKPFNKLELNRLLTNMFK